MYVLLCLLSVFVLWLGFAYFHDESPDKGRDAFYAISPGAIADDQNVAIALRGLDAPSGIDIIKHGRFVADTFSKTEHSLAKIIVSATGKLDFVGNQDEFDCWMDDSAKKTADNCASPERIKTLLAENRELLKRYRDLYNMPSWRGTSGNGPYVINLNKLILAEIKLDIVAGNSEIAFKKWLDNFRFISRVLGQDSTMIERAIFLVADGMCIGSLEDMLFKSPEISTKHSDELITALKPSSLERYNLEGMMRAEYNFFKKGLHGLGQDFRAHAGAGVAHPQLDPAVRRGSRGDGDDPALGHGVHAVEAEVHERMAQGPGIPQDGPQARLQIHLQIADSQRQNGAVFRVRPRQGENFSGGQHRFEQRARGDFIGAGIVGQHRLGRGK